MNGIETEWDFVTPTEEDIAIINEQAANGPPSELVVGVNAHAAYECINTDGRHEDNWLLTARIVLLTPECSVITAADFTARVPYSGSMTVEEAKAKWRQILAGYLMEEWLPLYGRKGCDDES